MGGREEEEYPDEIEERMINEEIKIWKKNTPFLYGESKVAFPACSPFRLSKGRLTCRPGYHARARVAQPDRAVASCTLWLP